MTASYDQLYNELDGILLNPSRLGRVAGFARRYGEDPDTLISDVRLAMWNAFRSYDWNAARGGVSALAERVLRNALSDFRASRRRDRLIFADSNDDQGLDTPERLAIRRESCPDCPPLRSDEWFRQAYQLLNERRRAVFDLKVNPTPAFVSFLASTGAKSTNVSIGEFLGFKKNQIDWDVRAINDALGAVLLRPDFEDLRDEMVREYGWPMVWASEFDNDQELVERIADQYDLTLEPSGPVGRESASCGSRVIEPYPWGCICYLRHESRTATLVILGNITWNERHVFRNNGSINLGDVVSWYADLETALKEHSMEIPRCFGEHDPSDSTCAGDPKAKDKDGRAPCGVRDRCVAFELHCKKTKTKPPDHLDYVGDDGEEQGVIKEPDKLMPALDRLISVHEIVNGKVRRKNPKKLLKRPVDSEKQSKAAKAKPKAQQKAAGKASAEKMDDKREDASDLLRWYLKRLAEKGGIQIADQHGEATAGEMYLVDRSERSQYVAVYGKKESGGRVPVTSIYLRPQRGCVEVRVAAPFGALDVKGVDIEDYTGKDGAFKIRIRNLKRQGLSLVADGVAALLESGKIELPSGSHE